MEKSLVSSEKGMPSIFIDCKVNRIDNETPQQANLQSIAKIRGTPKLAMDHLLKSFLPGLNIRLYRIKRVRVNLINNPSNAPRKQLSPSSSGLSFLLEDAGQCGMIASVIECRTD